MYIKQLECFIVLAETLNFSITADRMFTTQPAVSHTIKTLEEELGFKLFSRTNRSVELTPAGEMFVGDCREIVTHINIASEKARNVARSYLSTLIIGYEGNPAENRYMSEILRRFRTRRTRTQVYLKIAENDLRVKTFSENRLDAIFLVNTSTRQLKDFEFYPLFEGHFLCVMHPNHPLSNKDVVTYDDIKGETMIFLEPTKCPIEMTALQSSLRAMSPTSMLYYCDSSRISSTMIKAGIGISVMPDFECPFDPGLATVPFDIDRTLSYGIACHKSQKTEDVKEFIRAAKSVYEEHRSS